VKARWRASSNSGAGRLHGDRGTFAHTGGANDAISSVHDEHVCVGVDAHCVRAGKRGQQRVSSIATVAAVACSRGRLTPTFASVAAVILSSAPACSDAPFPAFGTGMPDSTMKTWLTMVA